MIVDRLIEDERGHKLALRWLESQKRPFILKVTPGRHRSIEQNRLAFKWYGEIADQWEGHSREDVRAYCKLAVGIPIRCEDDKFREMYERDIAPLPYPLRLKLMAHPYDVAVTRDMSTMQKKQFLDGIQQFAAEQGWQLTQPDDQGLTSAA